MPDAAQRLSDEITASDAPETAPQAVLLDGPLAGLLTAVPAGCRTYCIPLRLPASPLGAPVRGPSSARYEIWTQSFHTFDRDGGRRILIQVGTVEPGRPSDALMNEMLPSALAEQGLLEWSAVAATRADLDDPIPILLHGNPAVPCALRFSPFDIPGLTIYASCACGWTTGYGVPGTKRLQLVRAARKHIAGRAARRARLALPIRVADPGRGASDICYAPICLTPIETVYGRCDECGWRTEDVEPDRRPALLELCKAHWGPDGPRHQRNLLLRRFALPELTGEEGRFDG